MANNKPFLAGIATLILAVFIAIGTLSPPSTGGAGLPLSDKQLHFIAFCLLVLPLLLVRPRHAIWLAPAAIAYGGAIEIIQPLVGRSADWADFLADMAGVVAGVAMAGARHRLRLARR